MFLSLIVYAYKINSYLVSPGVSTCLISRKYLPSKYPLLFLSFSEGYIRNSGPSHSFIPAFHTISGCLCYWWTSRDPGILSSADDNIDIPWLNLQPGPWSFTRWKPPTLFKGWAFSKLLLASESSPSELPSPQLQIGEKPCWSLSLP